MAHSFPHLAFLLQSIAILLGLVSSRPSRAADPLPPPHPIVSPLRALPQNPRYFTDDTGRAIYLTGSHTWNTLQDWGVNSSIQPLDFAAFVKMLASHHHNFTLLWTTELPA